MNKKIFFLILILLIAFIDVKALDNVLEIGGMNYVLNKDINEEYYSYTVSNNTLVLNNYQGSHIYKEGTLNVIVNGDNYISDKNGLFLIRANDLNISGEGTLNFDAKNSAFSATNVSISDVTIRGTTTRELIYSSNELNINNVDIDFEAKGILILGGKVININNSIIKSSNRLGFRYTDDGLATIKNSDINMECSNTCISAKAKMTFNQTNAYFHGNNSASSNMELSFDETSFVISEDGVNYRDSVDYNGYQYLKMTAVISTDDNSLNQNNNSNGDNDRENNLSNGKNEDKLLENTGNSPNQDTDLDNKQENSGKENDDIVDNSKDNTKDELQNNNDGNNDNDTIQNDKADEVLNNENKDNIYTEDEYKNKDEIYTKNEFDKDNFLNTENPKTYDGILNSIIILIFSVVSIIISMLIIKRNANGKS